MKKLIIIPIIFLSLLSKGQSLNTMRDSSATSLTKVSYKIFKKHENPKLIALGEMPKISKQELNFNIDKYKATPSLLHPNAQYQQYILNPTNAQTPLDAIFLGILGWRGFKFP